MKKCPQCNSVFEDNLIYCTEDGELLIEETFILPSESSANETENETEEETLIHHEPIKMDIPTVSPLPEETATQIPQPEKVVPIIIEKPRNTAKYLMFWLIGLLFGAVLTVGILALFLFRNSDSQKLTSNENVRISNGKHNEPNKTRKDSEFNGFVLSENANIRSAPDSSVLETLPQNDRLNILERDGVWYRVICEHGVGGWMHGNTIRFNDDAPTF